MSHEITKHDSLILRDQEAWHGLGTVVREGFTAREAQQHALNWDVHGLGIYVKHPDTGELVKVDTHVANCRMIDSPEGRAVMPFGVVGSGYSRLQNSDLADFVDSLAQTGAADIETCGSIYGGKRVWFLVRMGTLDINGDLSEDYLLVSNSHDGSRAVEIVPTSIRVVCRNTLEAVQLGKSGDYKRAPIRITHTGKISSKLVEAKRVLAEYGTLREQDHERKRALADCKIDEAQARAFFGGCYASSFTAYAGTQDAADLRRLERQEKAMAAYLARLNRETQQFGGLTAWLALNAWTGYLQNDRPIRNDARDNANLFGNNARRSTGAYAGAVNAFLSA